MNVDEIIQGFFDGKYSVFDLPKTVYAFNVESLYGMLFAGFGQPSVGAIKEAEKLLNYRDNIGRFSGAKTFQQAKELTASVFYRNGRKRAFSDFKEQALRINNKYNVNWLKTEQNSVFSQAQNARKWLKFESEAEIFPILKYVTVGDERVRHYHKDLDGLKARVSDPIWDRIMPQNEFGCRCTVIQLEETRTTSKAEKEMKTRSLFEHFREYPQFDYNVGKSEAIFTEFGKGRHPYFKVPKEFREDLKRNFDLPTVEEVTGRLV